MIGKYQLIHIGGVTRNNEKIFRKIEHELTLKGYICWAPVVYDVEVWRSNQEMLDDMCYAKLTVCDIFLIATPWHIGQSTQLRISQCKEFDIPVMVYNHSTKKMEKYEEGKRYDSGEYCYSQSNS